MLDQLSVKNLVVVEDLNIEFLHGMTVVTGETGAGKSILVQALNLAIGGRSDAALVRHGKSKAEIIATFSLDGNQSIQSVLEGLDLEDGNECILRRVLGSDGKSRSYVNGSNVTLSTLRDVGCHLIDMHGQNEHQLLLRNHQHRIILDDFADTHNLCKEVNTIVRGYRQVIQEVDDLRISNELLFAQKDLLNHQLEELIQCQLDQDELDSIENNYKISSNASLLIEKISKILESLDDESGVNNILIEAEDVIGQAREFDDRLETIQSLLSNAQVQVQESIYDLTNYLSKVSGQEANVNDLETRINMLHDLGRKHRCQIPELLHAQNSIQNKLNEFDTSSDQLEELLTKQKQLEKDYFNKSKRLSEKRQHASVSLSEKVTDLMQDLGMPGSEILFCLNSYKDSIRSNGNEEIIIHVKTNVGQDLKPLSKVASGGELSRISLALSVVTRKTELTPSIVFDEVDVGISGSVAEIVGQLLKKLSDRYQIICVTHLAQVAAQGKEHLKVIKTQQSGSTFTQVTALNQEQRTDEVARILGGIKISEKTRIAAAEMIKASA